MLETKLYAPPCRDTMVARPDLIARIAEGARRKLTLVCAPAGFGKTTLLAGWLNASDQIRSATAWVSLDTGDNDPTLFWSYLIAGLQNLHNTVGERTLPLLYAAQPAPITTILTALINELHAVGTDMKLVLDDYHIIENDEIHTALDFFINHLPAHVHLIVASRGDLPFPTARLRAHNELTELRIADLQFSEAEARTFFSETMGLDLSPEDVSKLEARTEGWIAGLQLAALSLREKADVRAFVASFAGEDRYIADFLVEEVLRHQPESVRRFLVQTAVLDRMQGTLCDALTGEANGHRMLEMLEKQNLFIIPLDGNRQWYRYHHLFADALRAILSKEEPAQVPILHARASTWYEASFQFAAAIHHAKAAGDGARVAQLVEQVADAMYTSAQSATLYKWLGELPDAIAQSRPVLQFWRGWFFLETGDPARAKACLDAAVQGYTVMETPRGIHVQLAQGYEVAEEAQLNCVPGRIATVRAIIAQASGDIEQTVTHAEEALSLLPVEDTLWRGGTTVILGFSLWYRGALDVAYNAIAEGFVNVEKKGGVHFVVSGTPLMADIRVAQGRLKDAQALYTHSIALAQKHKEGIVRGIADLFLCSAEIMLAQGQFDDAVQYVEEGRAMGEAACNVELKDRWLAFDARREAILGNAETAQLLYEEAARTYQTGPVPQTQPYPARIARLWIQRGRLDDAAGWATEAGIAGNDASAFIREYEHLTYARLLLARYTTEGENAHYHQACQLLDQLMGAARSGKRVGSQIEIGLLGALAEHAAGKRNTALSQLGEALALAAGEGFVQVFADEGAPLRELLSVAVAEGIGGAYARTLLATLSGQAADVDVARRGGDVLVAPLSTREVEVLRLIAAGMKNQDIADQLFISLATVKRHISNIYGKLEVRSRTQAVAQANALGLL